MQLTGGRPPATRKKLSAAFALAALAVVSPALAEKEAPNENPAETKDVPTPPIAREAPSATSRPEDTSTKHVALEMAAYTDTDHVTVFTPSMNATIANVTAGATLSGHYLVDVVSAASVDIVSTASQRWQEVRQAGGLEGTYKPHNTGVTAAGSVSSEPDYLSYSLGAQFTQDFDEKNSTLLLGYGYGHDIVGYHFTPFSVFSHVVQTSTFSAGLTQVIDRSTVASAVFDVGIESGDQSKPYRYIPMFAPDVAPQIQNGASIATVNAERLPERPIEQLPLSRDRFSVTGRIARRFEGSTLRAEQRFYVDSWLLGASTTDARFIVSLAKRIEVWPHVRFHVQNGVSFWQRAYISESATGWNLPELRTGNRELGPLWTATGGGGAKVYLGPPGNPKALAIALHVDGAYTSYLDNLYITSRGSVLGALILEGEL